MNNSQKEIKKEGLKLVAIGSPIIATQLLRMGLNFTDTVMAGNLSALDLASVAIGNAIYMPIGIFCMATLIAINPIVSQFLGAREFDLIGKSARQMFWLVLMLAIPCFFLIRNLEIVMQLMGVTAEIIPIADGYLKAISWGILPLLAYAGVRYFSEGLSVTRPAMYIAAASLVLNVGANYVLMYGKLGFPQLGAVGTGYATSIINLFGAIVFIAFTASFKPFKRFNIFARTKGPEWKYIRELITVGVPNGISSSMEVLLFATVSLLMGTLSVKAAAAHQIAINVAATMFMIPFGLSMAISQRVGFSLGQGSMEKARFRGFVGIAICAGVMTLTAMLLFLAPEFIISIYTDDIEVAGVAVTLVFMAAIFQISDGLQVGAFGALRGLKDTRVPMIVNFISYWLVGFPTGYILGIYLGFGPEGLWIGLIGGLSVAAILHNYRFNKLTKIRS
ncbi:MAG: MATE family efflux transporter [Balneola sp.]|nr:MATE family efflux transporter [Balneola sp.]MBE78186.1 MATE family efflux transporter [Balneola sp.]|tara:strand:- start:41160 stop:42503 length:1344 start_codon:yes stop_codon:yes gene_type:complete